VYFPTVTICPLSPSDPEKVNSTATNVEGASEENFEALLPLLKSLPELSYFTFSQTQEALANMTEAKLDFSKYNIRELAFELGVKCEDLLEICKYKDEEISCCEYFSPIYSEHGFCYSFNPRYLGKPQDE
jgi:acid-sensing ion channel, other